MKILIVNSLFSTLGGGEKVAYGMYKLLKQRRHDVYFWAMDKKPYFEEDYEYKKYFTQYYKGVKDYLKNPVKYYYNYQAKHNLQKFVDLIKPNIIHIHGFWGLSSSVFNISTNASKILTIHDARCCPVATLMFKDEIFCAQQYCKNGNYLPCIINKCAKKSIETSIRRTIAHYIDMVNIKNIDYFITPSKALKDAIIQANIGIDFNKIEIISNFLSNEEFNTKPNFENKSYFLYVGRLSKEKGVNYLLQAVKELPKEIEFHIVGKGQEEENLKKYAYSNNLDNVKFLGFKNREEIKEEYQNCIATILPSNCFEIFGMTNIESFINGKPVIASNIGGIPEIVEDNVNGLLFEPTNVEQLKSCILKYWNNPDLVIEHGKNGYQKAITQYTEEKYYKELMKVYEEVLNESRK